MYRVEGFEPTQKLTKHGRQLQKRREELIPVQLNPIQSKPIQCSAVQCSRFDSVRVIWTNSSNQIDQRDDIYICRVVLEQWCVWWCHASWRITFREAMSTRHEFKSLPYHKLPYRSKRELPSLLKGLTSSSPTAVFENTESSSSVGSCVNLTKLPFSMALDFSLFQRQYSTMHAMNDASTATAAA